MNKLNALFVFFLCGCVACAVEPLRYKVEADRPECIYRCGERATFTVTITDTNGIPVKAGKVKSTLDNFGRKTIAATEFDLSVTNVFTVSGKLEEPGFLRIRFSPEPSGSGTKVWSVAYDPEKIVKGSPSPADFDAYWAGERARLRREIPLDPRLVRVPERCTKEFEFFRISFATFGRRVYGYLSVPTDSSKAPFPAHVEVNAAGFGDWTNDMKGRADSICMRMGVYDFDLDWRWKELGLKKKYDALNETYKKKYGCGYPAAGISDSREAYFFHPVLLGIDRAVDWLAARPDVDKSRFRYEGTSQGGGFGLYLLGLNHVFTRAALYVPAISDAMGYRKERLSSWPSLVENNSKTPEVRTAAERWAPYFDGANFASRIACPVRIAVGFSDVTCPPCSVYAAYNEIPAKDKGIVHGIGMTHSCYARFYSELGAWVRDDKAR